MIKEGLLIVFKSVLRYHCLVDHVKDDADLENNTQAVRPEQDPENCEGQVVVQPSHDLAEIFRGRRLSPVVDYGLDYSKGVVK